MTDVREEAFVDCPPERAQRYLVEHLSRSSVDGGQAKLRLSATIGADASAHATIEREAIVMFTPVSSAAALEYQVLIDWTPTSREPLPRFDGVFRVQWDEDFGKCRLVLEGRYEPPLGIIGKAFDAAVGHRIASNTLRTLLGNLRSAIESAYRTDVNRT